MRKQFGILWLISITIAAAPSLAVAQSLAGFDGTYVGVSNAGSGTCSPYVPVPRPLTVQNGIAQFEGGFHGSEKFQGNVSPQGEFTMRSSRSFLGSGKIESTGKATASVNIQDDNGSCLLTAVWQKQ